MSVFGGRGFDEIVHRNVWYGMMMSKKLGEVRDLNSTTSQILTECLLRDTCWVRDWRGGMGQALSCVNDLL